MAISVTIITSSCPIRNHSQSADWWVVNIL